jgi:predicted Zn-dependent protease
VGYDTWLERQVLAQIEQLYRREDDLTGLNKQYATLLEAHGKRIAIRRRHALLLAELGDGDEAVAAFKQILDLTPGDRANREEYVNLLVKLDRHEQAVEQLEALTEQNTDDAELWFRLAGLRDKAEQSDQVSGDVQRYLELSDGSEYAYLRAARLLERLEKTDDARGIYETLATTHADSPSAQEAYAAFLYKDDKKDEALGIWQKLADGADLNLTLHIARGLSSRQEYDGAFDLLAARREQFDREPLFYGQLIAAAIALKKDADAIPWVLGRVALSETVTELESAIDQAVLVCDHADQLEDVARQLAARTTRSVSETCLLAQLWEKIGDSQQADAVLAELAGTEIEDGGELLVVSQQIRLFSGRREWDAAANATRRILELPGGRKSLHVRRLVELYTRDYQIAEALRWIEPWKRLSPGSAEPWLTESRLLRMDGKEDDALGVLRKACQKFDDDLDLRAQLAQAYVEMDKLGDAERIYWLIYEQTDDLFGKLRWVSQLAQLAKQQGKTTQLVEGFEQRAANNRSSIVPLLALAEIHRELDDYEGRRRALTAASQIKSDDPHLLTQIARIAESEGNWQEALATLERAAPLDRTNRTREHIARLHLEYGDPEDGYAILYELAGGEDSDPRAIEAIADAMCGMDEWERAAEFLGQRIAQHPDDYRLRYLYGTALEEIGQISAAADVFVELLDEVLELPANRDKQPAFNQQSGNYIDLLKQVMPARAGEWIQLTQYRYTVYSYQQRQRSAGAVLSFAGTSSPSGVTFPSRVDDVRPYALTHLLSIAMNMTDDEETELARKLSAHGVESARALLKVGLDQNGLIVATEEILEDEPENETALAVHAMMRLSQRQPGGAEYNARAFEVFRDTHPQLAIMAAVQAATEDNQFAELVDASVELAERVEHPSPLVVVSLVSSVGGMPGQQQQQQSELDDAGRRQVLKLILNWYPQMQRSPQYAPWSFLYVVSALQSGGEPEAYVAFLEDEVARALSGGGGQNMQQLTAMFGSGQQQLLSPPTFPPSELIDFPSHLLAILRDADGSSPYSQFIRSPDQAWDAEVIGPLVRKVKDPVLRILLANQVDDDELADRTLDELLAAQQPRADAYLLAAGRAAEREDFPRASELLQKVRYLPMSREIRLRVDAGLVALAVELDAAGTPTESVESMREAGRQAALRLRRGHLDATQRVALVSAMEDLGLESEAKKLERVATASPTPAVASARVVYSTSVASNNVQNDRVSKLVADGKRELAAKLLAKEVAGQIRNMTANLQMYGYNRQQFDQIASRVDTLGLKQEVLDELDPGTSNNVRRLSDYAAVCELLGKKELARAGYERILEQRSRDDNTRIMLIMLLAEIDPEAARPHLEALSDVAGQMLGHVLDNSMDNHNSSLDERLAMAELAYRYFLVVKDRPRPQLNWVEHMLQSLGQQMYANGRNVPSLYAKKETDRHQLVSRKDFHQRRVKLHDAMCRAMLEQPQTARSGFRYLLAAAEAEGDVGDEFVELAEQALRTEANQDHRTGLTQRTIRYYTNQSQVRFRNPEEFLVRAAWKADDWSSIDDTLLPELEQADVKQPFESLTRQAKLYRATEDEFLDVARESIRRAGGVNNLGQPSSEPIAAVVEAWADRGLAVDIGPLVLEQLEREVKGQNHHQPPGYLMEYLDQLAQRDNDDATLAMLEDAAIIYVGPADRRSEFIKKNYSRNSIQWGTPNGRIYVWRQVLSQLVQNEHVAFMAVRHMEPYAGALAVDNLQYYTVGALAELWTREPAERMHALAQMSWLGDADKFQTLDFAGEGKDSPFAQFVAGFSKNEASMPEFKQLLVQRQESAPQFGAGLLLAAIDQEENPASVIEYLGQQLTVLRQLPDSRQASLAATFLRLIPSDKLKGVTLSESAQAALLWLNRYQAEHTQGRVNELLSTKRFEDLGIETYNVGEYLAEQLPLLLADDPASARVGFFKVCALAEDARRRGTWRTSYGDGNTLRGRMLGELFSRGMSGNASADDYLSMLVFLVDVMQDDNGREIEINQSTWYGIERFVQQGFQQLQNDSRDERLSQADVLRRMIDQLEERLGDRRGWLLLHGYCSLLHSRIDNQARSEIERWLDEVCAEEDHSPLADEWHTAMQLVLTGRSRPNVASDVTLPRRDAEPYHARLHQLLDDDNVPLTVRMLAIRSVVQREGDTMPLETAARCLRVFNEALVTKTAIPNEQQGPALDLVVSLLEGPAADEPEIEQLLNEWRDNWAGRYLRNYRQRNQFDDNPHQLGDNRALCRALAAYLIAGDAERAEQFLRYHEQPLGTNRTALGLLTRHGKHDLAARLFRAHWANVEVRGEDKQLIQFDAELRDQLPALLDQLDRGEMRYLAETMVASLPDDPSLDAESADRRARLVALAGTYDEIDFHSDAHRNRVLEVFTTDDQAALVVADAIAERYQELDLLEVAARRDRQQLEQMMHIVAQHCRNRLRTGDPTPMVETLDKLTKRWPGQDYELGQAVEPLVTCCLESIREDGAGWTVEQCAAIGPPLRQVLIGRDNFHLNYFRQYNTVLMIVHARAETVGEIEEWYPKLANNERNWIRSHGPEQNFWEIAARLFPEPSEENLPERMQFVRNFICGAESVEWMRWNDQRPFRVNNYQATVLDDVVNHDLLSSDEIPEVALELVEGEYNRFTLAGAVARWLADHEQPDGAVMLWRKALEVAPDKQPNQRVYAELGLAEALRAAGSAKSALEQLDSLDKENISGSLRGRYDTLKRELTDELAAADEPRAEQEDDEQPVEDDETTATSEAEQAAEELFDAILGE